jgi:hypothetical protein
MPSGGWIHAANCEGTTVTEAVAAEEGWTMMLVPTLYVLSVSDPVGLMEATGVVKDGGGVKGISIVLSEVLAGLVALAAVVGPRDRVGLSEVGAPVEVTFASEVGIEVAGPVVAPEVVVAPVGVGVFPVPTEVPSDGVMPEGVVTVVGPVVGPGVGVPSDVGM